CRPRRTSAAWGEPAAPTDATATLAAPRRHEAGPAEILRRPPPALPAALLRTVSEPCCGFPSCSMFWFSMFRWLSSGRHAIRQRQAVGAQRRQQPGKAAGDADVGASPVHWLGGSIEVQAAGGLDVGLQQ